MMVRVIYEKDGKRKTSEVSVETMNLVKIAKELHIDKSSIVSPHAVDL